MWEREVGPRTFNSSEFNLKRLTTQFIAAVKTEHEDFWSDSQPWLYEPSFRHVRPT